MSATWSRNIRAELLWRIIQWPVKERVSKMDDISHCSLRYGLFSKISKPAWNLICKLPMETIFAGIYHFWMEKFWAKSQKVTFPERADLPFLTPPKSALRVADPTRYCLWVKVRSYAPTQPPQIIFLSRGLVKGIRASFWFLQQLALKNAGIFPFRHSR